jgi:hypothetical protein
MARASHADMLRDARRRVDAARRWRVDDEGLDAKWRRLIDRFDGRHFPPGRNGEDRIAVNLSFSTINVLGPSVAVNNPKIAVAPRKPEDEDRSAILEVVINYWWKHHDMQRALRLATQDTLICGIGWLKVGWKYRERTVEMSEDEILEQIAMRMQEADEFAAANPQFAAEMPTDVDIAAEIGTTRTEALEDRPFLDRISPFDVFVDPLATSLDDAAWVAQRIVKPVEEVRNDRRYEPKTRSALQADAYDRTLHQRRQNRRVEDEAEMVTLWEFYDLRKGTVCVFAESGDGFLVKPQDMPLPFGHPFVQIRNYEVPDKFYPKGDLEELESLQDELNKTRSEMMNHRKRYKRKYFYRESAFGQAGIAALKSDDDNVMVPVLDDNQPFQDIFQPMPQTSIAPELYNYSQQIEADIDTVSGVSEYARGSTPEIRRTATEAAILQDAQNARAADKLAKVEGAITEVARKLVQIAQEFLTGEHVAMIYGRDGLPLWVPYTREDIVGEFDFEVEGGSTQPQNDTLRRQNAISMMQALGPLLGTVIDPREFTRHLLQFGFNIRNPDKFLVAQQPQMPGAPTDPMADPMAAMGGAQPAVPPEQMDPSMMPPADLFGGGDAVPQGIVDQLSGQVGLNASMLGMGQ